MALDIKEQYEVYRGNVTIGETGSQDEAEKERINFCRNRYVYMSNAKSVVQNKWLLAKDLYEVFEQHLAQGEVWNAPYRFPELFGAIQRKASELIYNLPEAKIHSTRTGTADFAIALQGALDQTERATNSLREKVRVVYDSLLYGTGILYEGYSVLERYVTPIDEDSDMEMFLPEGKKKKVTWYNGNVSERVDPRDFLIDDQAGIFYDETGIQGARDCFRRRYYPYSTFMERFKGFKNIGNVIPVAWGTDFFGIPKEPYPKEAQEQKLVNRYVVVYEYWNVELDMVEIIANNQEIYYGSNPYKHKRLPFVVYYDYRRDDSCWGISETEVLAPFILAKEELRNLRILDAKLALQPAIAVSGDVTFNAEENELQPGAIFTLRGLNGGKVQDSIMPLRFGEVPGEVEKVAKDIEDTQIVVTGDDTRALYENPDQLATQTMAKQQTAQKRNRSNIMQNTIESERSRVQMRLSNIVQWYCKPFQNINGDVEFRRIKIEGYKVKQDGDESKPVFVQSYGVISHFTLNPSSVGDTTGIELEIIDVVMQDNLKDKEIQDMLMLLDKLATLLPMDQGLAQSINVVGLMKQIAKKMDVDYDEIFPMPVGKEGEDAIDLELQLIMMGQTPTVDPNQDPMESLLRYSKFMEGDMFKKAKPQAKAALMSFIQLTLQNAKGYIQNRLDIIRNFNAQSTLGSAGVAAPGQPPQQGGGQGLPKPPGTAVPTGSQTDLDAASTAQQAPRGVANRLGYGAAQSPSVNT